MQPHANHAKKQLLQYKNGYAVAAESTSPADAVAAAAALHAQLANWSIAAAAAGSSSGAAAVSEPFVPAYVALDKKV